MGSTAPSVVGANWIFRQYQMSLLPPHWLKYFGILNSSSIMSTRRTLRVYTVRVVDTVFASWTFSYCLCAFKGWQISASLAYTNSFKPPGINSTMPSTPQTFNARPDPSQRSNASISIRSGNDERPRKSKKSKSQSEATRGSVSAGSAGCLEATDLIPMTEPTLPRSPLTLLPVPPRRCLTMRSQKPDQSTKSQNQRPKAPVILIQSRFPRLHKKGLKIGKMRQRKVRKWKKPILAQVQRGRPA